MQQVDVEQLNVTLAWTDYRSLVIFPPFTVLFNQTKTPAYHVVVHGKY